MRDFIAENIFKEIKAQITRPRHQDNIQRDANRLAWDYKDYISELSEEKEQNTRVFCNILHIDIKRYLKKRIDMIKRVKKYHKSLLSEDEFNNLIQYHKSLKRRAVLLPKEEQIKITELIKENTDKIKEYERQLLSSKTTSELSSIKRPKLAQIKLN